MTTKQEYRQFLTDNFNGYLPLIPFFYSWDFGLRFDLQNGGETNTDEYFEEVLRRATTIFEAAFDTSDTIFLLFMDFKYRRRKIRLNNYLFKQITDIKKSEIKFFKEYGQYWYTKKISVGNVAVIKLPIDRINYKNILKAISHQDFPPRQPRFDNYGMFTAKEVFFLNSDKKLMFHMYDDRGLDIIAADKETLRPIYEKHNDLILDYDREQIDKLFK